MKYLLRAEGVDVIVDAEDPRVAFAASYPEAQIEECTPLDAVEASFMAEWYRVMGAGARAEKVGDGVVEACYGDFFPACYHVARGLRALASFGDNEGANWVGEARVRHALVPARAHITSSLRALSDAYKDRIK